MASSDHDDAISHLVRQGAPESVAREVVSIARASNSMEQLRRLIGEPDRTEVWSERLESTSERICDGSATRVARWERCYSYHTRWLPIHFYVYEYRDGSIACAFAVIKPGERGKPAL